MFPSAHVGLLAELMASGEGNVPVVLGEGCVRSAGVPATVGEVGRVVFRRLAESGGDGAEEVHGRCPGWPEAAEEEVAGAFLDWLRAMAPVQRFATMRALYHVPVPLFLRDLADLVAAGHVRTVYTAAVDTLLEQALDEVGLRQGRDYAVTAPGAPPELTGTPPAPGGTSPTPAAPRARIVKLCGDVFHGPLPSEAGPVPDEAPPPGVEVAVVGHEVHDPPRGIDLWMLLLRGRRVWWVAPEPDRAATAPLREGGEVRYLEGEDGDPEVFFGLLATHLIRLPAVAAVTAPAARTGTGASAPPGRAEPEVVRREYFRGRLLKSQAVTQWLREARVPGVTDSALEEELDYQHRLVERMGPAVLDSAVSDAVKAVGDAVNAVGAARPEGGLAVKLQDWVQEQAKRVSEQAHSAAPDLGVAVRAAKTVQWVAAPMRNVVDRRALQNLDIAVRAYAPREAPRQQGWEVPQPAPRETPQRPAPQASPQGET